MLFKPFWIYAIALDRRPIAEQGSCGLFINEMEACGALFEEWYQNASGNGRFGLQEMIGEEVFL